MNELFVNEDDIETVVIKRREKEFRFRIRKSISWLERQRILSRHVVIRRTGDFEIDWAGLTLDLARYAIVEAPFEVTEENLKRLDESVGSELERYLPLTSFRSLVERAPEDSRSVLRVR